MRSWPNRPSNFRRNFFDSNRHFTNPDYFEFLGPPNSPGGRGARRRGKSAVPLIRRTARWNFYKRFGHIEIWRPGGLSPTFICPQGNPLTYISNLQIDADCTIPKAILGGLSATSSNYTGWFASGTTGVLSELGNISPTIEAGWLTRLQPLTDNPNVILPVEDWPSDPKTHWPGRPRIKTPPDEIVGTILHPGGVKERKFKSRIPKVIGLILNGFTEGSELVDCMYKALNKSQQQSCNFPSYVDGKSKCVAKHFDEMTERQIGEAINCALFNLVEDYVYGRLSRAEVRGMNDIFERYGVDTGYVGFGQSKRISDIMDQLYKGGNNPRLSDFTEWVGSWF